MQTIAALDLGSNSFHLLIATVDDGVVTPAYQCGKRTQLGLGMVNRKIHPDAITRGLTCIHEYMSIIQQYRTDIILTAATSALRIADNSDHFCHEAAKILQCDVDIISGKREAELIYQGVRSTTQASGQQMVVDIGGGSTEFILGYNHKIQQAHSLNVGCLSHFQAFYPTSELNRSIFEASVTSARQQIKTIAHHYQSAIEHNSLGCSGVIEAVAGVLKYQHWGRNITLPGLYQARESLLREFNNVNDVRYPGLNSDRRALYVAGLAITIAIFEELKLSTITHTQSALKEGLISAYLLSH
ncbi:Ppx/GppA phosphatase family protein [Sinobacterium caligoides]|uniref:Ppx/GppA phosphatase family protein n=1 Tax=Sinobacterium caligoides TaxID=933926 RepID=A0A3N2DQ95_9GAMM|nr:hypothetical protein [Sinobacterium caligoides]ROS01963.1 Ppx/GppA phosphatase family protein [Sinobacterium caligoides]